MKYIRDLYTQNDFNNLTNSDINNFILKNNIFTSSVTEDVIEYIRNKVI